MSSTTSAPSAPSAQPASDPTKFNKKTMVEYMMLTNKAFEHCIDTTMSDTEGILGAVKKDINSTSSEIKLDLREILSRLKNVKNKLNSPNKTISTGAVEGILYIIIQHCLGDKKTSEYTPYQKNVIQNIIFNILKKGIINDFETFLLLGIINKISGKEKITLAHVDTLIYMLDKLFLYKFPNNFKSNGTTNRGLNLDNPDTLPDIYNRYVLYKKLSEFADKKYLEFNTYFGLYNDRMKENAKTFSNNLPPKVP